MKRWVDALKRLIDARREPRRTASQYVGLTVAGKEHQVPLLDISPSGAMIGFDDPMEAGESVVIHVLDREPLHGQVRWSRGGRVGIGFDPATKQDGEYEEK
ncbi:PilZ domain-containing protein [Sphingomonas sp. HDW15A]|uniref:PilZ domain-containing protein n=1 Tax=Sphingomonas sp. HDW15A TaxID=2714942 RepID=UPI0014099AA2|nr:PilZ domain-containing protein [Sphingomonas sp. HDW15A]QIK95125.1 PilZ domain-containing protein [Sphingomonas sp. HDW15A]